MASPTDLWTAPVVFEPWKPQVGDYVRVERGPECRAYHAPRPPSIPVIYGRVEEIDCTWDDPAEWLAAALSDGTDLYEVWQDARNVAGHYYYVSDDLDTDGYLLLDEHFCAAELVPVDPAEAIREIEALRVRMARMSRQERGRFRLSGILGGAR